MVLAVASRVFPQKSLGFLTAGSGSFLAGSGSNLPIFDLARIILMIFARYRYLVRSGI
jgi:hypothetical protein